MSDSWPAKPPGLMLPARTRHRQHRVRVDRPVQAPVGVGAQVGVVGAGHSIRPLQVQQGPPSACRIEKIVGRVPVERHGHGGQPPRLGQDLDVFRRTREEGRAEGDLGRIQLVQLGTKPHVHERIGAQCATQAEVQAEPTAHENVLERLAFGEDSDQQIRPRREERRLVEVDSGPPVDAAVVALPRLGAQEGGLQRRRQQVRNPGPSLQGAPSAEEAPARPSPLEVEALGAVAPPSIRTRCASPSTTSTVIGMTESDSMRAVSRRTSARATMSSSCRMRCASRIRLSWKSWPSRKGRRSRITLLSSSSLPVTSMGPKVVRGPSTTRKVTVARSLCMGRKKPRKTSAYAYPCSLSRRGQAAGGLLEEQKAQRVSNADRKRSLQVDFRGHRVTAEPDRTHPEGDPFADPEGDGHAAVVAAVHLGLEVNGAKAVCTVQGTQAHHVVFKGARAEVGAVASPIDPQGACGDGQNERAARRSCNDQPPELGIGEGLVAHEVDRGDLLAGGLGGQRQGHGASTQGHSQSGGHDRRRRGASVNELDPVHRLKSPLIPDPFEERLPERAGVPAAPRRLKAPGVPGIKIHRGFDPRFSNPDQVEGIPPPLPSPAPVRRSGSRQNHRHAPVRARPFPAPTQVRSVDVPRQGPGRRPSAATGPECGPRPGAAGLWARHPGRPDCDGRPAREALRRGPRRRTCPRTRVAAR